MFLKDAEIFFQKIFFGALVLLLGLIFSSKINAQVMQSPSYRMESDTLNPGGLQSSSPNYILKDTLGELATGESNSASYFLKAGFWQMQEVYIAISSPSDLILPNMAGITADSSEGTVSWTIVTDNTAGYSTSISASTVPALQSPEDYFPDYTPAGADPDYNFTNDPAESSFGISAEGDEVISRWRDNGVVCNAGSNSTAGKCWDGLSVTPKTISGSSTSNHPTGATTTVRFRAESGSAHLQTAGDYQAVITVTALPL